MFAVISHPSDMNQDRDTLQLFMIKVLAPQCTCPLYCLKTFASALALSHIVLGFQEREKRDDESNGKQVAKRMRNLESSIADRCREIPMPDQL